MVDEMVAGALFGHFLVDFGDIACRGVYIFMCVVLRCACCVVFVWCVAVSPSATVIGRDVGNDSEGKIRESF